MSNAPADTRDRAISILGRELPADAVVLHDRVDSQSKAKLDHFVVASSGVWVITSHADQGRIERRNVGNWRAPDQRLYIEGTDQSLRVSSVHRRVEDVRKALRPIGLSHLAIRSALVFADGDFGRFAKRFSLGGVEVTWPARLATSVAAPGTLSPALVRRIAYQLDEWTTAT